MIDRFDFIIENFKQLVVDDGYADNVEQLFGKANEKDLLYLTDLYETYSTWSTVYRAEDGELERLREYKIPEIVIDFYRKYEPKQLPCLPCYLNLLGLKEIRVENSEYYPSAELIAYGLLTIGTTVGGNAVCMDLNTINNGEPRIVYADRSYFFFDEKERVVRVRYELEDRGVLTKEVIQHELPEISQTFTKFLEGLALGEYEDIESFYSLYCI